MQSRGSAGAQGQGLAASTNPRLLRGNSEGSVKTGPHLRKYWCTILGLNQCLSSTVMIAGLGDDSMSSAVPPRQFMRSLTPRPNPLEDRGFKRDIGNMRLTSTGHRKLKNDGLFTPSPYPRLPARVSVYPAERSWRHVLRGGAARLGGFHPR